MVTLAEQIKWLEGSDAGQVAVLFALGFSSEEIARLRFIKWCIRNRRGYLR